MKDSLSPVTVYICFLTLFLSAANIQAQNELEENNLYIKAAPLSLLDIYAGMSPRIGVEWKIKSHFSVYNEIGTYIPNANGMSDNTGLLGKIEFKDYLSKDGIQGSYFSGEFFYKHQAYGTYDSILTNNISVLKNYSVKKDIACLTVKTGILQVFDNGFVLDLFIGAGIRHRVIGNSLTADENQNILQDGVNRINIIKNQAGIFDILNFDLGVKIGYRIR